MATYAVCSVQCAVCSESYAADEDVHWDMETNYQMKACEKTCNIWYIGCLYAFSMEHFIGD